MSERVELRASVEWLSNLDAWRAAQSPIPTRGAAIRQLVDDGISLTNQIKARLDLAEERLARVE